MHMTRILLRKFAGPVLASTLILGAACKQQDAASERQSWSRGGGGSSDQAALAETVATLVYIAAKQARDRGDCENRVRRKSGEDRTLLAVMCERLAQQEANRGLSHSDTAERKAANPPNRELGL
jgi:hypothetical protein